MAIDAQISGPLPPAKFTLGLWQDHQRAETGITADTDGSAFGITLPPSGDTAEIGSATIDSIAKVGGFPVRIPAGQTQSIDIPPSLAGGTTGRTDLIVARCDTTNFTSDPGPVRLHRIEGTDGSSAVPAYGVFDLPLWSARRRQGEALNQTITADLRWWSGRPPIVIPDGSPMPASAIVPIGSRVRRGVQEFVRQLIGGVPTWVDLQANIGLWQDYAPVFNTSNVTLRSARYCRIGNFIAVHVRVLMKSMGVGNQAFTCTVPVTGRAMTGWVDALGTAGGRRGGNTGAHTFQGLVVANGSGDLNDVTVIAADKQFGDRWGINDGSAYPISWTDNGGAEVSLVWSYEV